MHRTTSRFWRCFRKVPDHVRRIAEENFRLLKENARHPSLHFKRVGKLWSVRIGISHRALAVRDGPDFIWVWIGTHDEYERIIRQLG